MATLALTIGGAALGSVAGPLGSVLLATAGGFIGSQIDNAILGVGKKSSRVVNESVGLDQTLTSVYGKIMPLAYGTVRLGGNVLWQSDARVITTTEYERQRTGKFSSKPVAVSQTRQVLVDVFVSVCAVPSTDAETITTVVQDEEEPASFSFRRGIVGIRRLWFNGELVYDGRSSQSQTQVKTGFSIDDIYFGLETQDTNAYIESVAGVNQVPAFRGQAGFLIRDFDIASYGETIPQINVEVVGTLARATVEDGPSALVLNPIDNKIYALSRLKRTITRINPDTLQKEYVLQRTGYADYLGGLPSFPTSMAVDASTGRLFCVSTTDASVTVLDPFTDTIVTTIPVDYYPQNIAADGDGNFWVTHPMRDKVTKINRSTFATTEYTLADAPYGVVTAGDGNVWVSCNTSVKKINRSTGVVLVDFGIGFFGAGMARQPSQNHLWVCNIGYTTITIINEANNTLVTQRNTGTWPVAIACNAADPYQPMAVATLFGNQVKVYSQIRNLLADYGTVAFPNAVVAMPDGRVFVSQKKTNFIMMLESR
jgi:DNA-binding beta-propeller fold protein YncE